MKLLRFPSLVFCTHEGYNYMVHKTILAENPKYNYEYTKIIYIL